MVSEQLKTKFYKFAATTQLTLGFGGLASGLYFAASGDLRGLVVFPAAAMIVAGCKGINNPPAPSLL